MISTLSTIVVFLAAQLPSEATLPGQKSAVKPAVRNLPSEATLPGVPKATSGVPKETRSVPKETRDVPKETEPVAQQKQLPGEASLPAGFVVEKPKPIADYLVDQEAAAEQLDQTESASDQPQGKPAAADGQAGPLQIGQAPPGLPWLRLNMHGQVGVVRALTYTADGSRLCAGGDDKTVEIWTRLGEANNRRWTHERAIRWPVERGPRGRLYAIAAAPGLVAMSGYGTMGGIGEIWLVDPATGELKRALVDEQNGHRQIVAGLSFPPGRADILASQDTAGRVIVWRQDANTGLWKPKQLVAPDSETLDAETLRFVVPQRRVVPIAMPDEKHVIVAGNPTLEATPDGSRFPRWDLHLIDIDSGKRVTLRSEKRHARAVSALAVTRDGKALASADMSGNLRLWDLRTATHVGGKDSLDVPLTTLVWSPNGKVLITGSGKSLGRKSATKEPQAVWQVWNVPSLAQARLASENVVDRDVYAIGINPQGTEIAYTQGSDVIVRRLQPNVAAESLRGLARPVLRVAFAIEQPFYRIAIGTRRQANGDVPLDNAFDLSGVKLDAARQLDERDWLNNDGWSGGWDVKSQREEARETHWLSFNNALVTQLPLHPTLHGRPTAWCWIPDREGRPFAVAVGTSIQGNVFIFRLDKAKTATILRQFRGHEGGVLSIAVSRDRRYLATGSDDTTVRIWNLSGFDDADVLVNRWGAGFEIRNGQLFATGVREDGPIHFRGVRTDDVLRSLAWKNNGMVQNPNDPAEMLRVLQTCSWDTQVVFDFRRREVDVPSFQMLPSWRSLASLFVAENREWAFWTPAGYYDASFDGHKLFGWQVNRGVDMLPEFFLAAQFRKALERPDVLNRLLKEGSLPAALRGAPQAVPDEGQDAVLPQYRLKPRVEILAPRSDEQLADNHVTIRAKVTVREGLELVPPKAFANGVVAPVRQLIHQQSVAGGTEYVYEWRATLPADPRILIQVIASTDGEAAEFQTVQVRQTAAPRARPRHLYVLAAGVNEYRDAQIQKLDFAANNARRVADAFRQSTGTTDTTTLLNENATRPMWSLITAGYAERLREEAGPDDLLVFFLSGHGVRDEETDRYFFVSANAKYDDLKSQRFGDCLSFDDFAAFADVPCRKLVVLDTCHSGAVQQPLRQQDLKAALRALQDDVVFTMTASEGSQEAAEDQSQQLGRFTARLIEALQGAADDATRGGDANGAVTLREASSYVQATVAADSSRDQQQQHPTVGPIDLLEFADFPLTKR